MKISEAFLVNTNNFDAIIKALVNYDEEEPIIDSDLMEELGYSDPNDLLVVRLLKDLNVINNEGEPAEHYHEFRDPETTKKALAKGIISAYEDLFREHPHIHKSQDEIKKTFEKIFKDKKTDLIIKYISGTFTKLISFVGLNTIDDLLPDDGFEPKEPIESTEESEDISQEKEIIDMDTENTDSSDDKTEEETDYSEYAPPGLNGNHEQEETDEQEEETSAPSLAEAFENGQADSTKTDDTDASVVEFENDVVEAVEEKTETAVEAKTKTESSEQLNSENDSAPSPSNDGSPMQELSKTTDKNLNSDDSLVQKALFRKFDLVYKMERWEDLLQTADEIINRYDDEEHPELEKKVVKAINRRAEALLELERPDDALEPINNIIDRFSDSENEHYYNRASQALMLKAQILEDQDDGELLGLYDTIVDRFESDDELADNEKLNQIILKRFEIVLEEKGDDEILEACSNLINRFEGNENQKDHLHTAMIKRAEILDDMGRDEEALEAYNNFLSAFGS